MSRQSIFRCDNCHKELASSHLPMGWLETNFWNNRWFRYYSCSYTCLVQWAEARETYYGNRNAENGADD